MNGPEKSEMDLFMEAMQLPAEQRSAFLVTACGGDAELRANVEALLEAHLKSGEFLEQAPEEIKAQVGVPGEKAGDWIGRYKLLQQIGEGGCGVVFMAEQEEPVRRKVAIKIVKPGMDTKTVIARFEAERQAMALMDHPNIAKVLDAGATESGRPYFVMELVRGIKITDYCDQNSLKTAARLDMFIEVCDAVQHAHQKGIIHRDLKPSNILVTTLPSGKPLAKVIDFGIAKATTGQRLTDKTMFTAFELLVGTPAYMSPEQAALSSVDIDTRSDIYSLGMLLYELLTGATPFDTTELLKRGIDEVRRVVRNVEPLRPSTRLSTLVAGDLLSVSRHRQIDPPRLIRELRGDLDWIVMKALEKDRERRYATVNGFAMDIRRFLGGEAILARPPSTLYKLARFVRRHKLLCAGACFVLLLFMICLVVTSRLIIDERQMRKDLAVNQAAFQASRMMDAGQASKAVDKYIAALELQKKFFGLDQPRAADLLGSAFGILLSLGKSDNAYQLLVQYPIPVQVVLDRGDWLEVRATIFARQGHWREAGEAAALGVKLRPDQPLYHALATLLIAQRNFEAYRKLCPEMVDHYAGTTNASIANVVAKDCLILPSSGANLESVATFAETAVTFGKGQAAYTFYLCAKALADYRLGKYQEAITGTSVILKDPFPYTQAEGSAVLAMAQFQLGQTNDAHAALAKLEKIVQEKLPAPGSRDLGSDWRDWIIAHALLDEAKSLIEGVNSTNLDWRSKPHE
jgi:tetratricopeptide (TPR) repeat protein